MKLKTVEWPLTVCKLKNVQDAPTDSPLSFLSVTPEEVSLVCPTAFAPANTLAREDGWRGMYIEGVLDFSLVGVLAKAANALAGAGIAIFAVSTYNTDHILVKEAAFERALEVLRAAGWDKE